MSIHVLNLYNLQNNQLYPTNFHSSELYLAIINIRNWTDYIPASAPVLSDGCYDYNSLVNTIDKSMAFMRDLNVGDYVFDGDEYTKIVYTDYNVTMNVNSLEIQLF